MNLSETKMQIMAVLDTLKPMETIIIRADMQGNIQKFFIKRTEAFFIVDGNKKSVADKLGLHCED